MNNLHVIVGLGVSGISCVRYLQAKGIPVAVIDTRVNPPNFTELKSIAPDIRIVLGKIDETLLNEAAVIVLSPGIPLYEPAIAAMIKKGTRVIGDIELFAEAITKPVIAITGTNAKSTVTTLVGEMGKAAGFKTAVGGNLGVPALDLINPEIELYVLELSSFQLETTENLHCKVATILNVTPDHMDRYTDLAAYQAAKLRIYKNAEIAVCNRDDALTEPQNSQTQKIYFTLNQPKANEFGLGDGTLAYGDRSLMSLRDLPVAGKHYQANALAALAIGYAFGFSLEAMLKVLRQFKGLPHRCQLIRELNQVKWYNDSKGTNVGASLAAIDGLGSIIDGKLVLIAGGIGKNADFSSLVPSIEKYTRHVVLIGAAAKELSDVIGHRVPISFASTMDEAVQQAALAARAKDSVLLSPACASFDMFKNFEHRGEVFTEIVNRL